MCHYQVVDANRMATLPYLLNFMVDRKDEKTCERILTDDDMVKFRRVSMGGCASMMAFMLHSKDTYPVLCAVAQ